MKKFLLDTSVILDDLQNLKFLAQDGQNEIFLSDVILSELDSKKELQNEMGYFVREFFRNLHADSKEHKISESGDFISRIFLVLDSEKIPITLIFRHKYSETNIKNDDKIIQIAKDYDLTLLTNDISLKFRALAQNIDSHSLWRDRVENPQDIIFFHTFQAHKNHLQKLENDANFQNLPNFAQVQINELDNTDSSTYRTGRALYGFKIDGKLQLQNLDEIISEHKPYIAPMNLEQKLLFALLVNSKNHITIASGATGSGKTLIALQAGICLLKAKKVDGIVYLRNTITANDKEAELGFRKGDETQKLSYFMYPLFSAINFTIDTLQAGSLAKRIEYRGEAKSIEKMEATEYFLQKHHIEIIDIAHARGITLANKFIIFDEVQNAQNATIKLIGTRVGEGSRIVFLGDYSQIDHPYLSKFRNGAITLLQKALKHDEIAGIKLNQTIRSDVAKFFGEVF